MSGITTCDLRIIFAFAIQVAKADRSVALHEEEILDLIAEAGGLSGGDRAGLADERPPVERSSDLSSAEAKALLVKTLCAVAFADDVRHDAEMDLIIRVNAHLGDVVALRPWEEWEAYVEDVVDTLASL